jgi:two-component system, OmpR family, sensor histidine kinase MprB
LATRSKPGNRDNEGDLLNALSVDLSDAGGCALIRRLTLRSRLALIAACTTAVTAVVVASFGYGLARRSVVGEVDASLLNDQQRFARRLMAKGAGLGLGMELPSTPIALVSGAGRILRSTSAGATSVDPADVEVARSSVAAHFSGRAISGRPYRFYSAAVSAPIEKAGQLARFSKSNGGPGLAIVVGRDVGRLQTQLDRLALGFKILAVLGVGLSGGAALVAVRAGTRSLKELHEITSAFAADGEYMRAAPTNGPPDIARLSVSFNAMLEAVGESRATQQRMIDDAAHELRTPLTSMQTNLDILERAHDLSKSDRAEVTQAILNQFRELRTLVNDLGLLAEQNINASKDFQMVDLRDVTSAALDRAQRRAITVNVHAELESFSVFAQPDALERAIVNVLDNAIKFSPANSVVTVVLRDGTLSIADQGSGIPEHERHRAFDRFWRSDEARKISGSGLGLAIVSDIIRDHRGSVEITESASGGTVVSLRLPHFSSSSSSALRTAT